MIKHLKYFINNSSQFLLGGESITLLLHSCCDNSILLRATSYPQPLPSSQSYFLIWQVSISVYLSPTKTSKLKIVGYDTLKKCDNAQICNIWRLLMFVLATSKAIHRQASTGDIAQTWFSISSPPEQGGRYCLSNRFSMMEVILTASMVLSYHLDYLQILHQLKLFIHFAFCDSAKRAIFKKGNFQYPA